MFVPCFVVHCFVSFLVLQSILMGKPESLLLYCFLVTEHSCSVALPNGAVGVIVVYSDHTHLLFSHILAR